MKDLLDIGFRSVGTWRLSGSDLQLHQDAMVDVAPALYAFVVDEQVKYVGKTVRPLQTRLYGYLRPGGSQLTNIRVKKCIIDALASANAVEILGFSNSYRQRVGRFHLNLPAGLEDDIIKQLRPEWNGGKASTSSVSQAKPKAADTPQLQPTLVTKESQDSNSAGDADAALRPKFSVAIGKTYFNQGFFNVPVDFARYFGRDGASIDIHMQGQSAPVRGEINRRVNQHHTPRIMGGVGLRDWIQTHVPFGARLRVVVHSPSSISISKK